MAPKTNVTAPSRRMSTSTTPSVSPNDEYDTPDTSIAVTPEASITGKSSTNNKRKRSRLSDENKVEDTTDVDMDAALAFALQEEEYAQDEQPAKRQKTGGSARKSLVIQDSDAENGAVYDIASESDSEELSSVASFSASEDYNLPVKSRKTFAKRKPAAKRKLLPLDASSDEEASHDARLSKARAGKAKATKPVRKAGIKARNSIGKVLSSAGTKDDSDISAFTELSSEDDFTGESSSSDDEPLALHERIKRRIDDEEDDSRTTGPEARASTKNGKRRGHQHLTEFSVEDILEVPTSRKDRERKKLEKAHPNIKTMWNELEAIPVIKPVQATQPESINRKLKSFQLEGLDWMIKQEKTHYKGGLLGDEMGMGKTIQAVSLIMSDYPAKEPTLVLVPPVALMQWSNEIKEYTDGKLNVLVFHGQNAKTKGMKVKDLKKYDVIMISYNSLESLHRKETKGWTRGEDIIKEASPIHALHYHRLILDEAHSIKSRTTGVAKACFALKSTYKWCLSGTPVQNRIGEFFSLLRFLEVRPFSDYFCKKCPCALLHWSLNAEHRCSNCKHSGIEHVSVFNQELLNPLTQSDDPAERGRAMTKLHMITARIMLRRMKRDHVSSMELPPKEVIIHNEFFGEIERDFSSSIMSNTARKFDTYVSQGVMLNNYANIFGLIMQMRQVANHPDLLLKKHAHEGQNVLVCNICDEPAEEAIKSKCHHEFCRSCVKNYVHTVEASGGEPDCPRCHIVSSSLYRLLDYH